MSLTQSPSDDDPDADGLPPGALLPDRDLYRADQLRAIFSGNVVALAVLCSLLFVFREQRVLIALCAAAVGATAVFNLIRWLAARRRLRRRGLLQPPKDTTHQP